MTPWSTALVSFEMLQPPRLIAVVNKLQPPLANPGCLPRPHRLLPGLPANRQPVSGDGGDHSARP
ncbi:MAG: hypothetical protein OXF25_05010 [Cyanobacteria bacterium MAG CAR3_bin_5]|nr:hypothetical protein [Cyanobacteria bacterium MAG CAR3_bin_5]